MNIAYQGSFLREGLQAIGHKIIPLEESRDKDLQAKVDTPGASVDLVLLELYGSSTSIKGLSTCHTPVALYLCDSPLNLFWAKDALRLADYAFVDQHADSVSLQNEGISAHWLPLCAQDYYFQEKAEKRHDITFIGAVDKYRVRRKNLLSHLNKYFPVNMVSGVSIPEAQKIFAESRIVLNESMFQGFTLRLLQGMAANSVILSDTDPKSINDCFVDGKHFARYRPDDLVEKVAGLLDSPASLDSLAEAGYAEAKASHTSRIRARQVMEIISGDLGGERGDGADRLFHELKSRYLFTMRYGGPLGEIIAGLKKLADGDAALGADAALELGNIYGRMGKTEIAEQCFLSALSDGNSLAGYKLSLLRLAQGQADKALGIIEKEIGRANIKVAAKDIASLSNPFAVACYLMACAYFQRGDLFNQGFNKQFADPLPDTAFELAQMAYCHEKSHVILDLMMRSLAPYRLEGELLPTLLAGINDGVLTKPQILRTAVLAASYYDFDTANAIIRALKSSSPSCR